ncbi:MAG: HAMP domain-containing histidine kinase [Bdellovibrionales bacterium]|nr:HAMP domain-containing histidine kinase [Bdellovibrionales bacterium]
MKIKIFFVILWMFLTMALAGWWAYFTMDIIGQLGESSVSLSKSIQHKQNMIFWEGVTWMALLFIGGSSLIYLINRNNKNTQSLKDFFAAFTHDLKTSLASLRIQVESLQEDLAEHSENPLMKRLVRDAGRLELQLENSLFLSRLEENAFYYEKVSLRKSIERIKYLWPELKINLDKEVFLYCDSRALDVILRNLFQNAVVHGKAHLVDIYAQEQKDIVLLKVCDDGEGFHGELSQLGENIQRHKSESGSGLGLFIVRKIMLILKGEMNVISSEKGFCVELSFPRKKGEE